MLVDKLMNALLREQSTSRKIPLKLATIQQREKRRKIMVRNLYRVGTHQINFIYEI